MEIETKEYHIYAGIGTTDDDVEFIETITLDSDLEARNYAELCALSLYNIRPKRTVLQIMEEDDINEDDAYLTFQKEAKESIIFFALEFEEINGQRQMTRHY
jgi:hypothetical protein